MEHPIPFPDFSHEEGAEDTKGIFFHSEDVPLPWPDAPPEQETRITQWIEAIIREEGKNLHSISYIFCSDSYLHRINLQYLQHDNYTDIITFPLSENPMESDIYISTERVHENAQTLGIPFLQELHRVMIHGILHLCGYPDKTEAEAETMRKKEDWALEELAKIQ